MSDLEKWLMDTSLDLRKPGWVRPPITCPDGFECSVQTGLGMYSTPRNNFGPWTEVEVGYPTQKVDDWLNWAEDPNNPTETVYAYIPVSIVETELKKRGWEYDENE